jgi:hypothetical protein
LRAGGAAGDDRLKPRGFAGQAVPLTRNGCANTEFSLESLTRAL